MNRFFAAALLVLLGTGPALGAQPKADPPGVISSDAIEAALQKPASAPQGAPQGEVVRTRGLRLQAREEESRAGQGAGERQGGGSGSVDLQIAFALDSATLMPAARQQLGELAKALKSSRLQGQAFVLAGHTDATGKAEHNRQLSLARANSVRDYLAQAGIDSATLSVAGYGADRPLQGRSPYDALNRRVEVRTLETEP